MGYLDESSLSMLPTFQAWLESLLSDDLTDPAFGETFLLGLLHSDDETGRELVGTLGRMTGLVVIGDDGEAGATDGFPCAQFVGPTRRCYTKPGHVRGRIGTGIWLLYVPGKPEHPIHVVARFRRARVTSGTFLHQPVFRIDAEDVWLGAWEAREPVTVFLSKPPSQQHDLVWDRVENELAWFSAAAHDEIPTFSTHAHYTLYVPRLERS